MKKFILTSVTVLFIGLTTFAQDNTYVKKWYVNEYTEDTGSSQNLIYEVHRRYSRAVKKEKLTEAKLLSDFIPDYPTNWVTDYVSVVISVTRNGNTVKAVSPNDVLSKKQKNILNTVDLGTGIVINVNYKSKNSVTDNIENNRINISMTVFPEIEAEYIGGHQQMKKYLEENAINKISKTTPKQFQKGIVIFTVNEEGEIINAKISMTSGDSKIDKLLLEVINKMPKWRPAENSTGIKVKQEFEFSVGNGGC